LTRENRVNVRKERDCLLAWGQKRNKKHVVIRMSIVVPRLCNDPRKEVAHMSNGLFGLEKIRQKEKLLTKMQMQHFLGVFE
jgi:hypothetical protein